MLRTIIVFIILIIVIITVTVAQSTARVANVPKGRTRVLHTAPPHVFRPAVPAPPRRPRVPRPAVPGPPRVFRPVVPAPPRRPRVPGRAVPEPPRVLRAAPLVPRRTVPQPPRVPRPAVHEPLAGPPEIALPPKKDPTPVSKLRAEFKQCAPVWYVFHGQWAPGRKELFLLNHAFKYESIQLSIIPITKQFVVQFTASAGAPSNTRTIGCEDALKGLRKHTNEKDANDCVRLTNAKTHFIMAIADGTLGNEYDAAILRNKRHPLNPKRFLGWLNRRNIDAATARRTLSVTSTEPSNPEDCQKMLRQIARARAQSDERETDWIWESFFEFIL